MRLNHALFLMTSKIYLITWMMNHTWLKQMVLNHWFLVTFLNVYLYLYTYTCEVVFPPLITLLLSILISTQLLTRIIINSFYINMPKRKLSLKETLRNAKSHTNQTLGLGLGRGVTLTLTLIQNEIGKELTFRIKTMLCG